MTRREIAKELQATLAAAGATIRLNEGGKIVMPKEFATSAVREQVVEYAAELRELLAERADDHSLPEKPGVPCTKCHGSGREPTALEIFDAVDSLLRNLMWNHARIALLRDEIRSGVTVLAIRWGGLDLRSPDGSTRTLAREH